MADMPENLDVAVIGAGAAGIAAARSVVQAGLNVGLLEARQRPGGRAYTRVQGGMALDMGCGWLHSAQVNPFVPLARDFGWSLDESTPPWQRVPDERIFSPARHAQFRVAQAAFEERLFAAAQDGRELAASELLEADCEWNPVLHAISTYVNGVELDGLSVCDFAAYSDSEINFRIAGGMGAFIAQLASGIRITHACPVTRIDHSGRRIRLETVHGDVRCDKVIVTVPTNVIAGGGLQFSPALDAHCDAAAHLPLGIANKIFLAVDGAEDLPQGAFAIGDRSKAATGSYHIRPFHWPVIEGYFGGRFARELEMAGEDAFAEQAIAEICGIFGTTWRSRLRLIAASGWVNDPFSQGSYSHALPGHAGKRAVLAAPYEDRIFFAGEATSPQHFSTAHGAWESGLRAAGEVIAASR